MCRKLLLTVETNTIMDNHKKSGRFIVRFFSKFNTMLRRLPLHILWRFLMPFEFRPYAF